VQEIADQIKPVNVMHFQN